MKNPFGLEKAPIRREENMVVIGGYIPQHLADRLALLALLRGQARSHFLAVALQKEIQSSRVSNEEAIQLLARKVSQKWQAHRASMTGHLSWKEEEEKKIFRQEVREIMEKRGISAIFIDQTLKKAGL